MKVSGVKTTILEVPSAHILPPEPGFKEIKRPFVALEVSTDQGIQGLGLTFFGGVLTKALREAVDALGSLTIGADPFRVEEIETNLRKAAGGSGPGGIFNLALSAIDIALWDIKGKALEKPVGTLLGGHRDRAPAYASGALLRSMSLGYVAEAAPKLVEKGFRQMKTQLGTESTVAESLNRIRTLRQAIGEDIDLMCDINQLWSVNQAIEIGRRLEEHRLFWLEDVVAHDDYHGLARVADALVTPICAGEYHYGLRPFRHMLETRSIDIVMIDLLRVGGITQWMKVASMAEAFNLPVVSHLLPEIAVHLIPAVPNGLTVEYMPWSLLLFEETPRLEEGHIVVPEKPGLGLELDEQAVRSYRVG